MLPSSLHRRISLVVAALAVSSLVACKSSEPKPAESPDPGCRADVGDDINTAVATGAEGAKTGAKTAIEGVKTFGQGAAGLVEGGRDEAKVRWNEGAEKTRETANDGAETTRRKALPRCTK